MYRNFIAKISLATLIMHNGQTSDPLNAYAKSMKQISSKRKKTDADFDALARIEYESGLYLDAERRVVIPGRIFEAVVCEGAKKSKEGKSALAGVFVESDGLIEYDGGPLSVEKLLDSERHRLAVPVRVGQARVVRTRPIFRNVTAEFVIALEDTVANEASLRRWIVDALTLVGIGDWRPRHGRGTLTKFEEVRSPLSIAAE